MKILSDKAQTGLVLSALFIAKSVESSALLGILDVEAVSTELASKMRQLGYKELTPELFRAFRRNGDIEVPVPGKPLLLGGRSLQMAGGF